ncbi:MAG: cytochrome-c peroxidase [Campylobacter sp.]|nr:cytochrome-c peroxidase [Campylobacter sp.]
MKTKFILLSCVAFSSLFSNEIIDLAKQYGLVAMPSDPAELRKMINEAAPDSQQYPTNMATYELGKKLYFEPRLSKSGIISCNTCHNLGLGGADGVPVATGHKWTPNPHHVNSPTVYNSVFNSVQFWDGRAKHLAEQAAGPMTAMPEMASTPELVEQRLKSIPQYVEEFKKVFNSEIKFDLVNTAIGVFERTLVTPSRYDKFLEGDENALSEKEKKGFKLFLETGCASCHYGVNLGGRLEHFQVVSKYKYYHIGDFRGDKYGMIKAPTLRNIELTAPYFHNGVYWSLRDAIKDMGTIQLGDNISDENADLIVTFLKSLTGKMPKIDYPILPPSTETTPKPDLEH